jgi:hypothetical protein
MYEYRQVLVRMRMGESNRAIAEAGLMGRKKAQKLRDLAQAHGWLEPLNSLPDNTQLATVLNVTVHTPSSAISSCQSLERNRSPNPVYYQVILHRIIASLIIHRGHYAKKTPN